MTSNFKFSLYLTKELNYIFSYPLDTGDQSYKIRQKLGLSKEDFEDWRPDWVRLPMFERVKFINALTEHDYVYITESHACRELAISKGEYYADWHSHLNVIYSSSYITLSYPENVPSSFKDVVDQALLKPYSVNKFNTSILCDLDAPNFGIAMSPGHWNKAWISLLTYFAKYGEFLLDLAQDRYGNKSQYSLDEIIQVILDSWSGQVGLYTAFGLWKWANRDEGAIHWNGSADSGIHSSMVTYTCLWDVDGLIEFLTEYELGLDRLNNLYVSNFKERLENLGFALPYWYKQGGTNDSCLSESPEWKSFMGYDDEDDDYLDDDYDFEEEDW